MASSDGHTSVLEILLKAGGDLHIPNKVKIILIIIVVCV
jgi:hypothetical protein